MANGLTRRLMQPDEIAGFVDAVIETGCDICAVGHDSYVIGDVDLPPAQYEAVAPTLQAIDEKFGDRDFLKFEIIAHLRTLGRYVDSADISHWSQNPKPS
jgi:hypothetical protein